MLHHAASRALDRDRRQRPFIDAENERHKNITVAAWSKVSVDLQSLGTDRGGEDDMSLFAKAFGVAILCVAPQASTAADLVGRASVIDGDTIEIRGKRIRLFGIDAPESEQTCQDAASRAYRCGQVAANALDELVGDRTVTCTPRDVDRFGRTVASCAAGGADLAEALVRAGLALDYTRFSRGDYRAAQAAADAAGAGMWRGPFVEPWLYRSCVRSGGRPAMCSSGEGAR